MNRQVLHSAARVVVGAAHGTGAHPEEWLDRITAGEFDIIIDLNGKARENLSKPGFHTVILVHALGDKTSAEQVFEDVKDYLNDLMLKLRGEEWD